MILQTQWRDRKYGSSKRLQCCLTFKLSKVCLVFKLGENAAFNKGRSETFPEHRAFPADYSPKNSLEAAVEQKK